MTGVRLEFAQFGHFDYFNIYRNSVSTAIENLGVPIGTSLKMYYEDLTVEPNRDYYYRIGVIRDSTEKFSEEFHVKTLVEFDPPYDLVIEFRNDETNRLELNWKLDSFVDEQRYYRSETPIDPENLPAPKAVFAGDVRIYVDTDIEAGKSYNVAISSARNGTEKLSAIVSIATSGVSQTLKSLFDGAVKGMAYNFQDISTMWQDTAGTIPVTAVDQLVARVDDLSRNNNHIIQTDVSKRPQLKQDAEGFYLWFDGTKALYSENIVDFYNLVNYTALCRFSKELSSSSCILEASVNFNNNTASFAMFQESQNISFANKGSGYNAAQVQLDADSLFIGVMKVLENPKVKMMRVNGIEKTRTGIFNQSTWGLLNHKIYVGARGGTSLFLKSKVRSIAFVGRELTSSEINDIENLLMP